jgi:hypothetical protein
VLGVIAGLAVSVMANHAGNITNPAVEDPFKPQSGRPEREDAGAIEVSSATPASSNERVIAVDCAAI